WTRGAHARVRPYLDGAGARPLPGTGEGDRNELALDQLDRASRDQHQRAHDVLGWRIARCRRRRIDGKGEAGRRLVEIAREVIGDHLEGVLAVRKGWRHERRRANEE